MTHKPAITPPIPRTFVPPSTGEVITCRNTQYFIGKQIGCGAFGAVYDCFDEWGNELAAKVLLPQSRSYEVVREEWFHELQNLQQLRHPHVTFIHQAFEYRDTFYIIVEKCLCTLKDLIVGPSGINGELWLPYVSRDILNGLQYIHDHGYVHKDLHAGNVFVSQQKDPMLPDNDPVWRFKIGDLGISRLEGDIRLFNTILAQWMLPPEFLRPTEFGVLGKHVDIYHVGLLLLSLLLNQIPDFTEDDIIAGCPRELAEGLSSRYSTVIARALRRHVNARTQSAIEMWREISLASARSGSQQRTGDTTLMLGA